MEKNITPLLRNIFLGSLILLISILIGAWIMSPYSKYKEGKIVSKVNIEMPCTAAFDYLGNSENAKTWSVFVDFIETTNKEHFEDGEIGSKRICYTKSDRSGFNWEEEVLEIIPNEYRKLSCYNFKNLAVKAPNLVTEQIYIDKGEDCVLVFTLDFSKKPSFIEKLKLKFSSYRIQSIFDQNLLNIRAEIIKDRP